MRINELFNKYKNRKPVLIGYLPAGYPTIHKFTRYVKEAVKAGLDCIEIGIPSKNSNLDGRVISRAMASVIKRGISPEKAISIAGNAISHSGIPGISMFYYSTVKEMGITHTLSLLKNHGVEGILVPNIPIDKWYSYASAAVSMDLKPIGFIGAKMNDNDIQLIVSKAQGFLYLQAYEGITGEKITLSHDIMSRMEKVKRMCGERSLPIAVGFGIKSKEDALLLRDVGADGIIIGTALIEALEGGITEVSDFISVMSEAITD